jgi:hypothetical protein
MMMIIIMIAVTMKQSSSSRLTHHRFDAPVNPESSTCSMAHISPHFTRVNHPFGIPALATHSIVSRCRSSKVLFSNANILLAKLVTTNKTTRQA